jgi:hypothetical protein
VVFDGFSIPADRSEASEKAEYASIIDEESAWWGATPIGHLKDDHRLRRNYLKGCYGDRINAVLAAAGYNFSLLRRWFEEFLRALLLLTLHRAFSPLRIA